MKAAVRQLRELQPWISEQRIQEILRRFDHPGFAGRHESYWLVTLAQELAMDAAKAPGEAERAPPVPRSSGKHPKVVVQRRRKAS